MNPHQDLEGRFKAFISYSGILCLLATLVVARRFFVLPKQNVESSFPGNPSWRSKGLVITLCALEGLHCYLAYISRYTIFIGFVLDPNPLTFKQLVYLSTACNVYICQVNLVSTINQALSSKIWKFFWHMAPPIIATINSAGEYPNRREFNKFAKTLMPFVVFGLSDDPFSKDIILGEYFHLMTLPVYLWKACEMLSRPARRRPEAVTTGLNHVFIAPIFALSIYGLIVGIMGFKYFTVEKPPVLWAYADLATYELFGNLYPLILICLICGMHLAGFEDRAEVESHDEKAVPSGTS